MNLGLRLKTFWIYALLTAFLASSVACGYKPAYLQGKQAEVSERWKVGKIDPSLLSPDEKATLESLGPPQYVRFYRKMSLDRERVYAWIYAEPVRFVTFLDGKKVDYVVVDDNPSSLNEHQKKVLFWAGVTAGAVAGAGLLYYYLFLRD